MPINTRLYSPVDFSTLAVLSAIIAIISGAACLRFDYAVVLPDDDEEAIELLILALLSTTAVSLLLAFALWVVPDAWERFLGEPAALPWLWLTPLGVFIGGCYSTLQMWFVRRQRYGLIARSKITQAGIAATTQIGLGLTHSGPLGLIAGQLLNFGAGAIGLAAALRADGLSLIRNSHWRRLVRTSVKYRRFPVYSTWEALANAASIQAPILLIAAVSHGPEPGYIALALFLLQAPLALVSSSIGQVYLANAPEALRAGRLDAYTLSSLSALTRVAGVLMGFLAAASPVLFVTLFGPAWSRAGELACWMTPWFFMQFAVSPISVALYVVGRQVSALSLHMTGLAIRLGGVAIAAAFFPGLISESYALTGFIFYTIYLLVVTNAVEISLSTLARTLLKSSGFFAASFLVGLVISKTVYYFIS